MHHLEQSDGAKPTPGVGCNSQYKLYEKTSQLGTLILENLFTFGAFLNAFPDFPRVMVGPQNPLRVIQDDTATLVCSVDSKPVTNEIKWTKNDRFIATSHKHVISRVNLDDAGTYICSADNGLGQSGHGQVILDVLH